MSFHYKNLFSINYKIQSIAISKPPSINYMENGVLKTDNRDKDQVTLTLTASNINDTVRINLFLSPQLTQELEKIYREERYLVLSFNRIEEEDE